MRIFTRYILKEVLSHALIGGALFTFVLFIGNLRQLLELAVRNSSSLGAVVKIVLFLLPNIFTVSIPMAVLVGILLGLSRLAADSEITAMRASGMGVGSFVSIVSIIAVAAWGLGLANTLYFAPKAAQGMLHIEEYLKNTQASYQIEPRVFYEDFKNYVLYVQDVRSGAGAANWHEVFLADMSDPTSPKVTTAEEATVVNTDAQTVTMRLRDGTQHETEAAKPGEYNVATFAQTDLPLQTTTQDEDMRVGKANVPVLAMSNAELMARSRQRYGKWFLIELQKRFAYPAACLVLMLVGVPLGLSSKRGGKSAGFVLTIILVFVYYFLSSTGVALARQGKVPVTVGVWGANVIFALCGIVLLRQMITGGAALAAVVSAGSWLKLRTRRGTAGHTETILTPRPRQARGHFPLILDDYVLREFLQTFVMVLVTFVMLMLVFTFFELLGDIIRNKTPLVTVGEYLINLTPSMVYLITPLSVLIAVLVTFGVMSRSNELTAMKATGISIYRMIVPVLVIASVLAVSLFVFDELYLPNANRRQEALRSVIKGKPAQTFERPDQKWIVGKHTPGQPERIFYYEFFDPDHDRFANITVFEFDPQNFSLSRRIFAASAHWEPELHKWVFEHGWVRSFSGDEISKYQQFEVHTFSSVNEEPQYFKKETRQSSEMSFSELSRYIHDLQQSGFDTMRLRVQLNHKLAYPLITLVMAVLAIPFALSMGKRGSLAGIAVAIGLAIAYFVVSGMFEAMGDVNMLPALLAAWSPDLLFALAGGYLLLRTPT
ncbi:LPS export ABC transporter permease LptG [Acidipila rosea]|uniref:LPS export ABC transporter permease LptF/LPS export ABC transporter permease LptG,TIGR04408 n=1 Tax=Acidipila rosea TaxID=768535 RepID=A0A4R1LC87_9BACT|nr:LPS export ABC transporter permease LptG [Acidipila rosea]MBW4026009.1 LPS export ABC transporter permease LptG [Acidobacteriota bacterium]MBW4044072.1 LPS export ABC transporter permease LptG [Acidobacteriota bacterium]TCK75955.1 LPS export ABC transporter permease LptF/LPS export ABC transporter permease LptG,TIGR04408 [Acidipila rosea]